MGELLSRLGGPRLTIIPVCGLILWCFVVSGCYYSAAGDGPFDIRLVEVLRIGEEGNDDGVVFGEISGLIAVDSRGRIFVGDQQASQIYAFGSDGEFIKSIGSKGEGPGEFSLLSDVRVGPGDSLYAFDLRRGRISAFDPSTLEFVKSIVVGEDIDGRSARDLIGVLESGFVVTYEDLPWPGTEFNSERYKYARIVSHTGLAGKESIVRVPSSEFMMVRSGNRFLGAAMPYPRDPVIYLGLDELVYSGSTESITVAVTAATGEMLSTIEHSHEAIPITSRELVDWIGLLSDETARLVRKANVRKTKPAYATFVVDDSGRIWVKPTQSDSEAKDVQWLVLDAQSRLVGTVVLPSSVDFDVITGGRAYAVDETGSDVVLVVFQIVES